MDEVIILPLTDELAVRVFGDDLAQTYVFHLDFFHKRKGPIKKLSDVGVYTKAHGVACAKVFSIESLRQSTQQAECDMMRSEDNSEGQTLIIPEGTLLHIVCSNKRPYLLSCSGYLFEVQTLSFSPLTQSGESRADDMFCWILLFSFIQALGSCLCGNV